MQEKTSKDYYFDSYSHYGIHEEMLKDRVRTDSYRNAIYQNQHLFKDKIVLDVGCGTGILSLFAAKAGAKHVIGVDMSEIIKRARTIVDENGYSDRITLIQGKMEEVVLPFDSVDIIISEWMGYFLLYESMLDTVLVARDKFLKKGGLLFPDKATMLIAGIEDAEYREEKINFWDNVYGFKMSCMKDVVLHEPLVDIVNAKALVTDACVIKEIDINTITKEELAFTSEFVLNVQRNEYVHAFVAYFDIYFDACHRPVTFSTGPAAEYTHWKQTIFYFGRDSIVVNDGEEIKGTIKVGPNASNPRDLDISLSYSFDGKDLKIEGESLDYRMC